MLLATAGVAFKLTASIGSGATDVYPRTKVRDSAGTLVATVDLAHVADGLYSGSWTPDEAGQFSALTIFYSDAGHTTLADYDRGGADIKVADADADSPVLVQEILGTITGNRIARSSDTIEMYRGDTRTPVVIVSQVDSEDVETLVDVTGATARLSVKGSRRDVTYKLQVTGVVGAGSDGRISFPITAAATEDLDPGAFVYDVEVVLVSGAKHTVSAGTFKLNADVSRP